MFNQTLANAKLNIKCMNSWVPCASNYSTRALPLVRMLQSLPWGHPNNGAVTSRGGATSSQLPWHPRLWTIELHSSFFCYTNARYVSNVVAGLQDFYVLYWVIRGSYELSVFLNRWPVLRWLSKDGVVHKIPLFLVGKRVLAKCDCLLHSYGLKREKVWQSGWGGV